MKSMKIKNVIMYLISLLILAAIVIFTLNVVQGRISDINTLIIFGVSFIFVMTTLGSAIVFFFKDKIEERLNKVFLGFASGVMIAASVWSLILPAIEQSKDLNIPEYLPAAVGFIFGGLFLLLLDKIIPHFHSEINQEEGVKSNFKRSTKLFLAVTLHNIPEGLSVGLGFGLGLVYNSPALISAGVGLALGIGLQNLPEGAAVALPLKEATGSNLKGFLYGTLSGLVEPIFAILGMILATKVVSIMPWALSFAAGAMIYVVVEELIPEAHLGEHSHYGTWAVMIGFVIMMILDVALG